MYVDLWVIAQFASTLPRSTHPGNAINSYVLGIRALHAYMYIISSLPRVKENGECYIVSRYACLPVFVSSRCIVLRLSTARGCRSLASYPAAAASDATTSAAVVAAAAAAAAASTWNRQHHHDYYSSVIPQWLHYLTYTHRYHCPSSDAPLVRTLLHNLPVLDPLTYPATMAEWSRLLGFGAGRHHCA